MRDRDTGQRRGESTLLDDTARLRKEAFRKLVAASRVFPQMEIYDPSSMVMPSAEDKATRTETPAQTPKTAQPEDN